MKPQVKYVLILLKSLLMVRKKNQNDGPVMANSMNNYPRYPIPIAKNTTLLLDGGVQQDYKTHIEISCRNVRQTASSISVLSIIPPGHLSY